LVPLLEIVDAARIVRIIFRRSDKGFGDALWINASVGGNDVASRSKSRTHRKRVRERRGGGYEQWEPL